LSENVVFIAPVESDDSAADDGNDCVEPRTQIEEGRDIPHACKPSYINKTGT
jgi:hypothetical protein